MTMKLGERCEFIVQSKYGYGPAGNPPKVPGDATLVFMVELIQVGARTPPDWSSMEEKDIFATAQKLKDDGNGKFKEKKLREAENLYRDGVYHIDHVKKEGDEEVAKLRLVLHQNLALVLNQ